MFKKLASIAGAALLAVTIAAPSFAADDVIILGLAGAHSGDLAGYGIGTVNAAKILVEKYNAKGGVAGKKLVLITQDDQCKPELGTNAATKLIADGAKIVIGHTCTGATKAALPLYKDSNIVVVSPSATAPALTQSGENPTFFRTIASDDEQAKLGADFVLNNLKAKKVAILHDKADYGKGYAEFVQDFIKKDGRAEVVLFEGITTGAVDYSGIIQKVRSSGADVLVFGGYDPEASKLVTQMRKKRINIPFVSEDGVKVDSFIRLTGEYAEGVYASGPKDTTQEPAYITAVEEHKKMFNSEPGRYYPEAYSAIVALLNAVEKAGGVSDPGKIMKIMREDYVETPLGKIRFDAKGDAEGVGFAMSQVKGGKFVTVK